MQSSGPAPQPNLAEEIRSSEEIFVSAALKSLEQALRAEYPRLRGYAIEAGKDAISLSASVTFGFDPANRFVLVETVPNFQPRVGSHLTQIAARPV